MMETLFEYGSSIIVPDREGLENYLRSIWQDLKEIWPNHKGIESNDSKRDFQPFLSFDGNLAKANNFVGFINYQGLTIEIYPKVFKFLPSPNKELMHRHLFFWFKYCRKIKFPFNQSFLDNFEIEQLPELILYLISEQIYDTVSTQPFMAYEEVEEALWFPKGRINFNRYTNSIGHGRNHLIDCDYEPFIYDNALNRIIKYCVRLLKSQTKLQVTIRLLDDILFILDEVDDRSFTVGQLSQIKIPNLFTTYDEVLQSCRMILENQIYSNSQNEMKNWSLFFPMELIFEDFITGFIQAKFSDIFKVEPQKSNLYLHQSPQTFNIQHDILLTHKFSGEKIILDTKYKPRWGLLPTDNKKGVNQNDLYQMISYSYRRGTDKVVLLFPNATDILSDDFIFRIEHGKSSDEIKIKVVDVPFWSSRDIASIEGELFTKLNSVLTSGF